MIIGGGLFLKGGYGVINQKPQLKINKDGQYVGLSENRMIPWKNVDGVNVLKQKDENGRNVRMLMK